LFSIQNILNPVNELHMQSSECIMANKERLYPLGC